MALVPVENKTNNIKHVAGILIPAGETRFIDDSRLPKHAKRLHSESLRDDSVHDLLAQQAQAQLDRLNDLIALPVKKLVPQLHTLTLEDLDRLDVLEQASQNRVTIIEALTAERLRRAEIENNPDLTRVQKYIEVKRVGE